MRNLIEVDMTWKNNRVPFQLVQQILTSGLCQALVTLKWRLEHGNLCIMLTTTTIQLLRGPDVGHMEMFMHSECHYGLNILDIGILYSDFRHKLNALERLEMYKY